MIRITIYILLLFFGINLNVYSQTWTQLEAEYNLIVKNGQADLQLNKAKEIYSWVNYNENDTSIHLPISLKLIGNSFMEIYPDSSLAYYNFALEILDKQNRLTNIQTSKIHYNKSKVYALKGNDILELIEIEKSIEILEKLNYPDFPYCTWPLNSAVKIFTSRGDFQKKEVMLKKNIELTLIYLGNNSIEYAICLIKLGEFYSDMNDYKKSLPYFLESLAILKKTLGEEHHNYSSNLLSLGNIYADIGDNNMAEAYYLECLDIYKKTIGEESQEYASILMNLGILNMQMKKSKRAELYMLRSLSIFEKFAEENPNYDKILKNLSILYSEISDYKKAEDYCLQSLTTHKKLYGEENPNYAMKLMSLGNLYVKLLDYKKAEFYYLQSLFIQKKVFGEQDADYSSNLMLIGNLYSDMSDYNKAESYYLQSLEIQKKVIGEENKEYSNNLMNLAILYTNIGDYKMAESYYLHSLLIQKKLFGEENSDYALILNNLGVLYSKMSYFKKAEAYLFQSLNINKKIEGEENFEYASNLMNLGIIYFELGDYKKAEHCYIRSLAIKKNIFKEEQFKYVSNIVNIGNLYKTINDYKNAEVYYLQSLEIYNNTIGEKNVEYAIILMNLGNLYTDLEDSKKAESNFSHSLSIFRDVLGQNCIIHPDYPNCLNNLGLLYYKRGEYKKAKPFFQQSFDIINKTLKEDHPEYANTIKNLGALSFHIGDFKKAEHYFLSVLTFKNKMLVNNFTWLTEQQREAYWKKNQSFYMGLNLFSAKNNLKYCSINNLAFNANLISKSLLLATSIDIDKKIASMKDVGIKNVFEQLKSNRSLYTKLESEGSDKNELIDKLTREADSLDKILVNSVSEFRTLKERFDINWQNVQSNLPLDATAIEFSRYYDYFDSTYNYMSLIVKQGDKFPELVKLCTEDELKQYSPETELKEIYDLVWKPLLPSLTNVKTIYYSPSGILNNIPFQALYKEENGQREYVMDKFTLHQLTSTRYLALGLKQKEQETIEPSIALFGGINYNDFPNAVIDTLNSDESSEAAFLYKNAIVHNRELDSTRTGASFLPGTKKEVESISDILKSKQWQVDIAEGKNASENKIKSLSGSNSKAILHIATHGFAYPDKEEKRKELAFSMMRGNDKYKASDNPMIRSGLLFGGANLTWQGKGDSLLNTTNEDGVLTAYELSQLDLSNTKLAVLSACETGKGAIQGNEGTFGLKRALKLAGVDNMIVSLWKVPDDATMEMMTIFYSELANTKKPVSSFETAQKAMRIKYPEEPKKWAGFVFVR